MLAVRPLLMVRITCFRCRRDELAQDGDHWRALVNTLNLQVTYFTNVNYISRNCVRAERSGERFLLDTGSSGSREAGAAKHLVIALKVVSILLIINLCTRE